jgi:hypothetical protein
MGGFSAFPALAIQQPEDPLKQFQQIQQIRAAQTQNQTAQLENQQRQQDMQDRDALTRAMAQWNGSNVADIPGLVTQSGGSGKARLAAQSSILDMQSKASDIVKNDAIAAQNNADALAKQNDIYRGRVLSVMGIQDPAARQQAWDAEITKEEHAGTIQPGQFSHQYPGDLQALNMANHFALGSQIVKDEQAKQTAAIDAWKPAGPGKLVNVITNQTIGGLDGPKIDLMNKAFEGRYQVLNPGKPLPDYLKLQPNATPGDFDNIDKILEGTERAQGTATQQQQTAAIRAQTFELSRDKQDLKPVTGTDPKTGQQVIANYADAQKMGLTGMTQASDDMVNKAYAARHWLNLATKPGDPASKDPADLSITQLIDKLDKAGKLGPLASRWNDFLAGKFGSGDADYAALNAKMGLSTTLLQQAHVGNRGSSALLEHFEDLANQKKLDAPTLRAGFNSEINYMRDRAADPNPPNYVTPKPGAAPNTQGSAAAGGGQITVKDPTGGIHTFADQASADRFKKLANIP